jgi:hypothetical protein
MYRCYLDKFRSTKIDILRHSLVCLQKLPVIFSLFDDPKSS